MIIELFDNSLVPASSITVALLTNGTNLLEAKYARFCLYVFLGGGSYKTTNYTEKESWVCFQRLTEPSFHSSLFK